LDENALTIMDDCVITHKKAQMIFDELQKFIKNINNNDKVRIFILYLILEQERRIVLNLYNSTIKNYQDCFYNFQQIQNDLKKQKQTTVVRSAEIMMNRQLDQSEIENIMNDPGVLF
jgi:hypothetical protein